VYMVTNLDPNDPYCPRTARFLPGFVQLGHSRFAPPPSLPELFAQLRSLLTTHGEAGVSPDSRTGLCLHLDGYGTCSSTLLAYSGSERRYVYHFAPGHPCQTPYTEVFVPPGAQASQPPSIP
jgi:hypothetical protein